MLAFVDSAKSHFIPDQNKKWVGTAPHHFRNFIAEKQHSIEQADLMHRVA
jgi:hypothetical protein